MPFIMKFFASSLVFLGSLSALSPVQAQPQSMLVEKAGCVLKASAYIDPSLLPGTKTNPASRFDLQLFQPAGDRFHWDFVLPDEPNQPLDNISRAYGAGDYRGQTRAVIRVTLRQFDLLEERVTFKDLDLEPVAPVHLGKTAMPSGPRFLALKEARTLTTPSGISVTLPASKPLTADDFNSIFNGNIGALWVPIQVTPNTKLVSPLPDSPLFRRHGRAITIKLEVPEPEFLVSYAADNTYTALKIGIPNLKTATHLDELTLIVRQRTDLQSVPVEIQVPVYKPASLISKKPKARI